MAGRANRAGRCRTWKFTTNSFGVTPAIIPSRPLLHPALPARPVRISAEEFLAALDARWSPEGIANGE